MEWPLYAGIGRNELFLELITHHGNVYKTPMHVPSILVNVN